MYWPYLNMRAEELRALAAVAPRVAPARLVIPILRPVSDAAATLAQTVRIAQAGLRVAVVVNTNIGLPGSGPAHVDPILNAVAALPGDMLIPTFEMRSGVTRAEVQAFVARFAGARRCAIVHRDHNVAPAVLTAELAALRSPPVHAFLDGERPARTPGAFTGPGAHRLLVRDGFQSVSPNGAYPATSAFDDLVFTHRGLGWDGFGDFAAIGDQQRIQAGGNGANHFAFHVTEETPTPDVTCNHFVSTVATHLGNLPKYQDALRLLIAHVGNPPRPPFQTLGVNEYIGSLGTGAGLGLPKRFSTMHHVEMVERIIRRAGAAPFV